MSSNRKKTKSLDDSDIELPQERKSKLKNKTGKTEIQIDNHINIDSKHYKSFLDSLNFKNFYSLVPVPGASKQLKNVNSEVIQRAPEFRAIPAFIRKPSQVLMRSMSKAGDTTPSSRNSSFNR